MNGDSEHPRHGHGDAGTARGDPDAMTPEQVDAELARQAREDPDGTLISDFLAGDLDEESARAVQRRLERDPDFARRAEPYVLLRDLLLVGQGETGGAMGTRAGDRPESAEAPRAAAPVNLAGRFRVAAAVTFLVGGAIGGGLGYRLAPVVTTGMAFGASGMDNTDGETSARGRMVVDSAFAVALDPDSRLAYVDAGRRSTFPAPPGQHEIQLDGGGAFELMLPTARELRIRTPFVTVRGQRAKFRIRLDPPCTTTVSVSEGEIVLTRRFVADSGDPMVFAGRSLRVACDQGMTEGPRVPVEGPAPVSVDSTVSSAPPRRREETP